LWGKRVGTQFLITAAFTQEVEDEEIETLIPRSNPIALVELAALLVAVATFARSFRSRKALPMIDSECVPGAVTLKVIQAERIFASLQVDFTNSRHTVSAIGFGLST